MIARVYLFVWRHQVVLAVTLVLLLAVVPGIEWCESKGYGPWRHA